MMLLSNNHILVKAITDSGKNIHLLLDTGCPYSYLENSSIGSFRINDIHFVLRRDKKSQQMRAITNFPRLSNLIGENTDGVIGADFFALNDILIDFENRQVQFNQSIQLGNLEITPLTFLMIPNFTDNVMLPTFEVSILGLCLTFCLDTGAMHSILHSGHAGILGPPQGRFEEYNPILGEFSANYHRVDISIGQKTFLNRIISTSQEYDNAIEKLRIGGNDMEGILGVSTLSENILYISYKKRVWAI